MTSLSPDTWDPYMPDTTEPQDWFFTFGSGHTWHGEPVGDFFVRINGTAMAARRRMVAVFGDRWSHQYTSEEAAGVQRFGLTELVVPAGLGTPELAQPHPASTDPSCPYCVGFPCPEHQPTAPTDAGTQAPADTGTQDDDDYADPFQAQAQDRAQIDRLRQQLTTARRRNIEARDLIRVLSQYVSDDHTRERIRAWMEGDPRPRSQRPFGRTRVLLRKLVDKWRREPAAEPPDIDLLNAIVDAFEEEELAE
jgi:hypothetical protein